MSQSLTTEQAWNALEKELFAVLGMVTSKNEARTAGIVYVVRDRKLYIATGAKTWKARHVGANPHVSLTVPIAKRIPFLPWIKIPAATVTFAGTARILPAATASPDLLRAAFRHKAEDRGMVAESCLIEVTPVGDFVTYGVGVPLMQMREPERARGRASVNGSDEAA
jgi:hypothetical protein